MGFFKKVNDTLNKINKTSKKIDNAKANAQETARGMNKNKMTDDERADNRKCNIWSLFNILFIIGAGVAGYFCIPMMGFDFESLLLGGVAIIAVAVGLIISIRKEFTFMREDVVGFGAKLLCYFVIALFVLMVLFLFFTTLMGIGKS